MKHERSALRTLSASASLIASLLLVVVTWELGRQVLDANDALLPSSLVVARYGLRLMVSPEFWQDTSATLLRAALGFLISGCLGVALGMLIGSNQWVLLVCEPIMDFVRSIPVSTLYPAFVLLFGIGDASKIAMIFTASVFIVALSCAQGVREIARVRIQVVGLLGATRWQTVREVLFWEALPSTLVGLRVALGLALVVGVLTEMLMGAEHGVGQAVMESYSVYNMPRMYAYIASAGLVGLLINRVFRVFESRILHWTTR